ncbi:HS12B-like protein, partial [Mya arenaria]
SIPDDERLKDISGKTLNAKNVFTQVILYLKNNAIENIEKKSLLTSIESHTLWILIVPAIWTDTAKCFMKSAAKNMSFALAGISSERLKIVIETEAAAVLFRNLPMDGTGGKCLKDLNKGSVYAVLDAGVKKRDITLSKTITIVIGYTLRQLSKSKSGRSLEEAVAYFKYEGKVIAHNDKLRVDPSVPVSWYDYPIQRTVQLLSEMLGMTAMSNCTVILMVGGLSQSIVLQNAVKEKFPYKKVVIPPDAELVVAKGAIKFAYNPLSVQSRIVKYTYGSSHKYSESCSHKVGRRELDKNGDMRCYDNFVLIVKEDKSVPVDDVVDGSLFGPIYQTQNILTSEIFISTSTDTEHTTDSSCTKIGQVTFKIREEDFEKGFIYKHIYKFGGTEIKITTMNTESNEEMGEETEVEFRG